MSNATILRDERTIAVENASYRWAYLFVAFGALMIAAIRSFALQQASWDLLSLVIASGVIATVFQARQRVLNARWLRMTIIAVLAAVVVAVSLTAMSGVFRAVASGYDAAKSATTR